MATCELTPEDKAALANIVVPKAALEAGFHDDDDDPLSGLEESGDESGEELGESSACFVV